MAISKQLSKHFRDVFLSGNWTCSNLKAQLSDVTWQEANVEYHNLNSIVKLTYHIGYYVTAICKVLQDKPLNSSDKESFDHPTIKSEADWEALRTSIYDEVELVAKLIEKLPDNKLNATFVEEKYGTYFRNINGVIEHTHYHLGQIALLKKLIKST